MDDKDIERLEMAPSARNRLHRSGEEARRLDSSPARLRRSPETGRLVMGLLRERR